MIYSVLTARQNLTTFQIVFAKILVAVSLQTSRRESILYKVSLYLISIYTIQKQL